MRVGFVEYRPRNWGWDRVISACEGTFLMYSRGTVVGGLSRAKSGFRGVIPASFEPLLILDKITAQQEQVEQDLHLFLFQDSEGIFQLCF